MYSTRLYPIVPTFCRAAVYRRERQYILFPRPRPGSGSATPARDIQLRRRREGVSLELFAVPL